MKSHNLKLAQDNARLKKEIKNWAQRHSDETARYNVLEMSWRRRGVSNFRF